MKVLIVNEDDNFLRSVSVALKNLDYEVDTFSNSSKAWEAFQQELYPIVVTHLYSFTVNGMGLTHLIKGIEPRTDIIMTSEFAKKDSPSDTQRQVFEYIEFMVSSNAVERIVKAVNAARDDGERLDKKFIGKHTSNLSLYVELERIANTYLSEFITKHEITQRRIYQVSLIIEDMFHNSSYKMSYADIIAVFHSSFLMDVLNKNVISHPSKEPTYHLPNVTF